MDWHDYWMSFARTAAQKSKDRSTQIGAALVRDNRLLTTGYNGFPRHVEDDLDWMHERPTKYIWTVHAEINAILNAAREGISTSGSTLYTTMSVCSACAPLVAQAGILEVVCYPLSSQLNYQQTNPDTQEKWRQESITASSILACCKVKLTFMKEA